MKSKIGIAVILCIFAAGSQMKALPVALMAPASEDTPFQQGPGQLHVQLGKSFLITSQQDLQRVSITDSTIASTVVVSPTQILIHGLKAGSGTLILWDSHERPQVFDLVVDLDINALRDTMRTMFPGETLQVAQSGGSLVLTGNVSSKAVSERAAAVAATVSPAVVNMVQTTEGRQTVLLQVKFAEVDRAAIQQLGMNLFSTGATNTLGATSTQQFDPLSANVGAIPANVRRRHRPNLTGYPCRVWIFRFVECISIQAGSQSWSSDQGPAVEKSSPGFSRTERTDNQWH